MIWLELYRWKWLGIRTLKLDENYTVGHTEKSHILNQIKFQLLIAILARSWLWFAIPEHDNQME
jgi:hypothetical protein